jgi:hypothetical protein
MTRMSTALSLSVVVGLFALAGCKTFYHDKPATPVAIAKQACEITALAEERDVMIGAIDSDAPEEGAVQTEHRWTIAKEKLLAYRAEVDASYRFVTSSCNSYNLCMENNRYDERACDKTRQAWVDSHDKFNELAISINKHKPWRKHRGGHHGGGHNDGDDCRRSNCGSLGGYSTDCCYDGD